jgi:hypothetical protein
MAKFFAGEVGADAKATVKLVLFAPNFPEALVAFGISSQNRPSE